MEKVGVSFVEKAADASPYALILIAVFVMFVIVYKLGINAIKEINNNAIQQIRTAYNSASKQMQEIIENLQRFIERENK